MCKASEKGIVEIHKGGMDILSSCHRIIGGLEHMSDEDEFCNSINSLRAAVVVSQIAQEVRPLLAWTETTIKDELGEAEWDRLFEEFLESLPESLREGFEAFLRMKNAPRN